VSSGAKAIYNKVIPDDIKKDINEKTNGLLKTGLGKQLIKAAATGADAYNKFAEKNPDAVRRFENVFNIMSFGLSRPVLAEGAKAAKVVATEAGDIVGDAAKLYTKTAATTRLLRPVEPLTKQLNSAIDKGISEVVNIQRKDLPAVNRAVNAVLDNSHKLELFNPGETPTLGKLPTNKFQFDDALDQLYHNTYEGSTLLKQLASEQGVRVTPKPIIDALETYKNAILKSLIV